ncbi:diguanylate cyclase/phosphodiesterase (GGDEF & EAL domains) with PAS/PAC sensor(s) [hydrothermal vent metagenome]|uniref:Diguanylate cyclase/phosphodiesterase (GGDEF & EAL domains) with PAS/PAC sensor(S) n=1 Tax=hydrothermal vent metagenome TaxID=652676 RepID=A0A3B0T7H6_9ZZZZ
MPLSRLDTGKNSRPVFNPYLLSIALAVIVIVLVGGFVENQNRFSHEQDIREKTGKILDRISADLEGNINANILSVQGMVNSIASEPDISQERFSAIAAGVMANNSQLHHIAAAPDLVTTLIHPIKGNEKSIGGDISENTQQREDALRARKNRKLFLASPVELKQGGQGLIARFPVFLNPGTSEERFWGLISAVIDMNRLYIDSGLVSADLSIEISIAGKDGERFFGAAGVTENNPVVADVHLPGGSWKIAAVPRGGWNTTPTNIWLIRILVVTFGTFFILPIVISNQLSAERRSQSVELRQSQGQLEVVTQRLKLALEASQIGVWEMNMTTGELIWDNRMKELYGLTPEDNELKFEDWRKALHPDDLNRAVEEFHIAVAENGKYQSEFRVLPDEGAIRNIRAMGAAFRAEGGQYIVGVNWDVSSDVEMQEHLSVAKSSAEARNSDLEQARAQMEHNSLHDSLTGLPNRRYLDRVLMAGCTEYRHPQALLHIDLDRFKQINDTLGHAAGDAMLAHAADILKANIRKGDFLARTGGDEFVIVPNGTVEVAELENLATRILAQMRRPVPYEGHECRFGASVGIAHAGRCDKARKRLLINADIALYRAKDSGRNRFEVFTDALEAEVVRNKCMADDILSGLDRNEFLPFFQPQFDARTLDIVGVEALARWEHPTEGLLSPDAFLGIAGELNVVPIIDRLILEQALWQATRWKANGLDIPKVSVNVSAGRLHDKGLIESLDGLAIAPGTLSFELLESIFLDDTDKTVATNIERLKTLGIDIEIDDFGTGYASIVSLLQLNPRRLKIDRCLVMPIVESKKQRQLVASIIDIGHSLGIEVTAEGVETMEHARILKTLGCNTLQGYAFAAPLSAAEFMAFVGENRWRKVG